VTEAAHAVKQFTSEIVGTDEAAAADKQMKSVWKEPRVTNEVAAKATTKEAREEHHAAEKKDDRAPEGYHSAKDKVIEAADATKTKAKAAAEDLRDKGRDLANKAQEGYDATKEKVGDVADAAKSKAKEVSDAAQEGGHMVAEKVREGYDAAKTQVNEMADGIREGYEKTKHVVGDAAHAVKEKAKDLVGSGDEDKQASSSSPDKFKGQQGHMASGQQQGNQPAKGPISGNQAGNKAGANFRDSGSHGAEQGMSDKIGQQQFKERQQQHGDATGNLPSEEENRGMGEKLREGYETAKVKAGDVAHATSEKIQQGYEKTKQVVGDAAHAVKEKAKDLVGQVQDEDKQASSSSPDKLKGQQELASGQQQGKPAIGKENQPATGDKQRLQADTPNIHQRDSTQPLSSGSQRSSGNTSGARR
jgi:hypothetical protein